MKSEKYKLSNSHTAPIGVYDAAGNLVLVPPGGSREAELTEGEAAAVIRGGGPLSAKKVAAEKPKGSSEAKG